MRLAIVSSKEVASCHHETLSFVLSVRTHAGFYGQHNVHVFLCRTRAANMFKGFLLRLENGRVHDLVHRTIQCALLLCDLLHAERSALS